LAALLDESEAASASTIKRQAHDLAVASHSAAQFALLVEIETHLDAVVPHLVLFSVSSPEDHRHSSPREQPTAGELLDKRFAAPTSRDTDAVSLTLVATLCHERPQADAMKKRRRT
jgi:hypothetical protein